MDVSVDNGKAVAAGVESGGNGLWSKGKVGKWENEKKSYSALYIVGLTPIDHHILDAKWQSAWCTFDHEVPYHQP